jgi:hypothetical protein
VGCGGSLAFPPVARGLSVRGAQLSGLRSAGGFSHSVRGPSPAASWPVARRCEPRANQRSYFDRPCRTAGASGWRCPAEKPVRPGSRCRSGRTGLQLARELGHDAVRSIRCTRRHRLPGVLRTTIAISCDAAVERPREATIRGAQSAHRPLSRALIASALGVHCAASPSVRFIARPFDAARVQGIAIGRPA